jgi:hypothetical protein
MRSRLWALVLIPALLWAASGDASIIPHLLYGKRIAGQVVDADSGKPIPGAHVALIWRSGIIPKGFTGHNSRDICYHAAATVTDAKGRFDIPSWHKWSTYDVFLVDPVVLVYVRGYEPVQELIQGDLNRDPAEHLAQRYALRQFGGAAGERLHSLFAGLANQGCEYGGESQKTLYPMLRDIFYEARQISTTPSQIENLHSFALEAAYAALALDPFGPAREADLEAFITEHLK